MRTMIRPLDSETGSKVKYREAFKGPAPGSGVCIAPVRSWKTLALHAFGTAGGYQLCPTTPKLDQQKFELPASVKRQGPDLLHHKYPRRLFC